MKMKLQYPPIPNLNIRKWEWKNYANHLIVTSGFEPSERWNESKFYMLLHCYHCPTQCTTNKRPDIFSRHFSSPCRTCQCPPSLSAYAFFSLARRRRRFIGVTRGQTPFAENGSERAPGERCGIS